MASPACAIWRRSRRGGIATARVSRPRASRSSPGSFRSSPPHLSASAHVAAQLGGVPAALQIGGGRPGWRARRAARLADLQPSDTARWQADVALVDLLLAPAFDPGSFLRRQILLDTSYMNAVSAGANWRTRLGPARAVRAHRLAGGADPRAARRAPSGAWDRGAELAGLLLAPVAGASWRVDGHPFTAATKAPVRGPRQSTPPVDPAPCRPCGGALCGWPRRRSRDKRGAWSRKPVDVPGARKPARAHAVGATG